MKLNSAQLGKHLQGTLAAVYVVSGDDPLLCQEAADAIRAAVRSGDIVARWGGDEFVVLGMGDMDDDDELDKRLFSSIQQSGINLGKWPGGVSIGTASTSAGSADIEALIRAADKDMYSRRRGDATSGLTH